MKKSLLIGATSLILAAMPALTFATESTDPSTLGGDHDVTVGEVDETTYSVDINWGDMAFDWKYDLGSNSFDFKPHYACNAVSTVADGKPWLEHQRNNGWLFLDDACTQAYTGEIADGTTYYATADGQAKSTIEVIDTSTNGKITPSASFAPADGYGWVLGTFGVMDSGWRGSGSTPETPAFIEGKWDRAVSVEPPMYYHKCELKIKKNPQAGSSEAPTINPNDKIGTVTVSISPATE